MSSHFRRKHFKNTRTPYLFFVGLCGYQNLTQSFSFIIFCEVVENVTIWKILIFRQLCSHLRNFPKELHMPFWKWLLGTGSSQFWITKLLERFTKNNRIFQKQKTWIFDIFYVVLTIFLDTKLWIAFLRLSACLIWKIQRFRIFRNFGNFYFKNSLTCQTVQKLFFVRLFWGQFAKLTPK